MVLGYRLHSRGCALHTPGGPIPWTVRQWSPSELCNMAALGPGWVLRNWRTVRDSAGRQGWQVGRCPRQDPMR